MLIEFKVANFRSFREEQTLSLVAGAAVKDKTHADSLVETEGVCLLKTAGIFGPNASGKSNVVRAFKFMQSLVIRSATRMNLGDPILEAVPFRLDAESPGKPCSLEITVLLSGTLYVYGFSANTERVVSEWLRARPADGKMTNWLARGLAAEGKDWVFGGPLKKEDAILREKTRENGLALSRGAELNVSALSALFLWFRNDLCVHDLSGSTGPLVEGTAARASEDEEFRKRVLQLVRDADFGISSIEVSEEPSITGSETDLESARNSHRQTTLFSWGRMKRRTVTTYHPVAGSNELVGFTLSKDESKGTQRFFALAGPILDALDRGQLVVLDEFECSMHPLLSRKIVELFQSSTANKKGAQLVFSTHDASLMSQTLMRRDQIWFTEKKESGATELFSLYDFDVDKRPRANSAFERNYFAGRFGAVPRFGRSLEDLEIDEK